MVVAVQSDARLGESYLERAGAVSVRLDGDLLGWSAPELGVDADEVEVISQHPLLSATVRHSFGASWGVRLALANLSSHRLTLTEVVLGWEPTWGWPAWALAAGAVGSYAVAHPDGHGALLGGVLTLGAPRVGDPNWAGTRSRRARAGWALRRRLAVGLVPELASVRRPFGRASRGPAGAAVPAADDG